MNSDRRKEQKRRSQRKRDRRISEERRVSRERLKEGLVAALPNLAPADAADLAPVVNSNPRHVGRLLRQLERDGVVERFANRSQATGQMATFVPGEGWDAY